MTDPAEYLDRVDRLAFAVDQHLDHEAYVLIDRDVPRMTTALRRVDVFASGLDLDAQRLRDLGNHEGANWVGNAASRLRLLLADALDGAE